MLMYYSCLPVEKLVEWHCCWVRALEGASSYRVSSFGSLLEGSLNY